MEGVSLKFYTYDLQKHHGILLHQWLLEFAKKNGVMGGSAIKAIAGYGKHHVMHEEHFFELGSNVPVEVTFFLGKDDALRILELLKKEKINLFYSITMAEFGFVNET